VNEFSADWLALREPADAAARSVSLTRAIAGPLAREAEVQVLDLAAGTGSNARYLADHLSVRQRWLLVDGSSALLAQVPIRMSSWGIAHGYEPSSVGGGLVLRGDRRTCRIRTRLLDLRTLDDDGIFAGRVLVTASALLDLVSEVWLRALADRCRDNGAAVLFALTYDGGIRCAPEEPEDEMVRELVNRHQRTDKGFGAALGPDAAGLTERCFAEVGYRVRRARSDWELPPDAIGLQRLLIDGWVQAATATAPAQAASIRAWRDRRLIHVEHHRSRLTVGHEDLAAWPTQPAGNGPIQSDR
jgi:hypothetical protein